MNSIITKIFKGAFFTSAFLLAATSGSNAQCSIISSDNYTVNINVKQVEAVLNTTTNCTNGSGYNYNIKYNYAVTISGTNPQALSTLQGTFSCGQGNTLYFPLPVGGGSGTAVTGANPFRNASDCATANLSSLGCTFPTFALVISGKGIGTSNPTEYGSQNVPCALAAQSVTPLPVKLLSFDAAINNSQVELVWATATELNNAYFILERSTDARSWNSITKIDGAGTSRVTNTYTYTDEMPVSGENYYRLKQVDQSGEATYSKILAVEARGNRENIAIYPNPSNGNTVSLSGINNAADWSVKIVNTSSAVVYQSATAQPQISLPTMPAGLYFVQLHNSKTGAAQVLKLMRN